jgi:Tol biopolymer transport system component
MTTIAAGKWWATATGRFALAAVVLLAGITGVLVARGEPAGFCRVGTDLRPKEAPPAPMGPTEAAGVWFTDPDGSDVRHVAYAVRPDSGQGDVLQWLGDGRLVHNVSNRAADSYPVVTTLDGRRTQVTGLPAGSDQAWSPDGSRVVFVDKTGLATVAADGTDRRQLTTFDGSDIDTARQPEWSPDGSRIVFTADSMPKSSVERLEIVNADGTGHRC